MRPISNSRPVTIVAGALLLAGVTMSSSALAAPPDLRATTVGGPGQVNVDSNVLATIKIDNLGDPITSDYFAEVVLSQDTIIDPTDVVVATLTSDFIGSQSILCYIPNGILDVPHIWGLRVTQIEDTDLSNNWTVGPFVNVQYVDLALDDPSPISVAVNAYGPKPEPIAVTVSNVGTDSSIVVFGVEKLSSADWLTVDAPNSFAVGGLPGNDVFLLIDQFGLAPGVYATSLRFQNSYYEEDYEELDVTLTVGRALFNPGDKIFGQIDGPGDVDELEFDAVLDMKLVLRIRSNSGDLKPKVSIVDEFDTVIDTVTLKHSGKHVKKILKLKGVGGRHVLRIEGAGGTSGGYAIRTHRLMPKRATMHSKKFKGLDSEETAFVPTALLPGGVLEFAIDPNSKFEGPLAIGLSTPGGTMIDLSSAMDTLPSGIVKIEGIKNVDECGCFILSIGGFGGGSKEKVKVMVLPYQPQQGHGKVYID